MKATTPRGNSLYAAIAALSLSAVLMAREQGPEVVFTSYQEARPILEALREALPTELKDKSESELASMWPAWTKWRDEQIRARLVRGDEDSLANFLLFGTSFTSKPRITLSMLAEIKRKSGQAEQFLDLVEARADDLIRGMIAPANNERLLAARRLIESMGHELNTPLGRQKAKAYLLANLARALEEQESYAKTLESARLLGDPTQEFIARSKLFRDRGLSSDTSLMPNFAIEESLRAIKSRGLLAGVRRVAVIGPGLDFTDKQDGYDFYPQQTLQPFAVIDSLLKLGLARAQELQVMTLDLSPKVNEHLQRARERARHGLGYLIHLPLDRQISWRPELLKYWSEFGSRIAIKARPVPAPPALGGLRVRAVKVNPKIVSRITPRDVNIVLQRLEQTEGFDLIIATNIFVYYDTFEQSLALLNVARMLRSGGFLLSNNALLELPSIGMRSVGYQTVIYSDRPDDGDHIVWYQYLPASTL
jgi:signal transduction histidine kinase